MMHRIALLSRPSLMFAHGRTRASRVRFLRLGLSFAAVAILSASTCSTASDDSLCGKPAGFTFALEGPVAALTSTDLDISFSGGVRTFSWSRVVENVCSNEHAKAQWTFDVLSAKLPPGWKVNAGYLLTDFLGRDLTLKATDFNPQVRSYEGEADIGLTQAFGGDPARFVVYLEASFTSQGDVVDDRAVMQRLLERVRIEMSYRQPKN
jgi:hypothetical protein